MKQMSTITRRIVPTVVVGLLCLGPGMAGVKAGPTAWMQMIKNNNHIIEAQSAGAGDPAAAGEVTIDFYGHAAFKMTSPAGMTLLFDPCRETIFGSMGMRVRGVSWRSQFIAVTLNPFHFDHDSRSVPTGR